MAALTDPGAVTRPTELVCPDPTISSPPSVFLAGGITGCPDWQAQALALLPPWATVYNPRRVNFPLGDALAGIEQIAWENERLQAASVLLFWFPSSGPVPQPIALYELGAFVAATDRPAAVGAAPGYIRELDVRTQLGLMRPGFTVWSTLAETCAAATRLLEGTAR